MVTINLKDEFAPLKVVIVHDGSNAIDFGMVDFCEHIEEDILQEYPETGPIYRHRVIENQDVTKP